MTWSGQARWGPSWVSYRGPSSENTPHAHVAIQLVMSCTAQPVAVHGEDGRSHEAAALAIRPLARHAIESHPDVRILFIEPQAHLAMWLVHWLGDEKIAALPRPISALLEADVAIEHWPSALASLSDIRTPDLDPRVVEALKILAVEPQPSAIRRVAMEVGLSTSRLRTLVRDQLGVPLSTWLVWRKLERTTLSLAQGCTMASAALEGGFADQAHFCRTMRRMFGITPHLVGRTLRGPDAVGAAPVTPAGEGQGPGRA